MMSFIFNICQKKTPTSPVKQDKNVSDIKWWAELHNKKEKENAFIWRLSSTHTDENGPDAGNLYCEFTVWPFVYGQRPALM